MAIMNKRRNFLLGLLGGIPLSAFASATKYSTPSEVEGPFYPVFPQKDKDFDLTFVKGKQARAKGQTIWIEGRVVDSLGNAIEDATVDLWQANAAGRYRHPHDSNPAPLDPNFQGWAIVKSGKNGQFKFKTILPGAYPASRQWMRPPHIHFKVNKVGYQELTTQMYFPGEPLNNVDLLLQRKAPQQQRLMIATKTSDAPLVYSYNIYLQEI